MRTIGTKAGALKQCFADCLVECQVLLFSLVGHVAGLSQSVITSVLFWHCLESVALAGVEVVGVSDEGLSDALHILLQCRVSSSAPRLTEKQPAPEGRRLFNAECPWRIHGIARFNEGAAGRDPADRLAIPRAQPLARGFLPTEISRVPAPGRDSHTLCIVTLCM